LDASDFHSTISGPFFIIRRSLFWFPALDFVFGPFPSPAFRIEFFHSEKSKAPLSLFSGREAHLSFLFHSFNSIFFPPLSTMMEWQAYFFAFDATVRATCICDRSVRDRNPFLLTFIRMSRFFFYSCEHFFFFFFKGDTR